MDDVISTGSTLEGMRNILLKAGATVTVEAAIFTEGDPEQMETCHLPGQFTALQGLIAGILSTPERLFLFNPGIFFSISSAAESSDHIFFL